jgi:peroxiredoxin
MPSVGKYLLFVGILACLGPAAFAHDEEVLPGHSKRGEIFDSGPRQSAYIMGGTGKVHFPVTHKNPEAQKFIDQGLGQLHGFWYVESERSFRAAQALDPTCTAMAWWGVSLANELRPTRAKQFADLAAQNKAGLTDREKMYIDALSSEGGYRAIMAKYPDDLEAKALEVWRIWFKMEHGKASHEEVQDALELAKVILKVQPYHPINHAVIHICNATQIESHAVESADRCGDSAPSIGHMWHMPTHIYFTLQRYPQAAWQLEASIRTEHARMMHDRVIPDQVHLYAHNNEWLVRTLLYLGRVNDARRTAMHMIDIPRHPRFNLIEPPEQGDADGDDDDSLKGAQKRIVEVHGTSAYYGRDRLLQVLRQFEYWDDLIDECKSNYIEETSLAGEQGKVHMNLGVAYYCKGDIAAGNRELEEVRRLGTEQEAEAKTALEGLEASKHDRDKALQYQRAGHATVDLARSLRELESYRRIVSGFFLGLRALVLSLGGLLVIEAAAVWLLWRRKLVVVLTVPIVIGVAVWLFLAHLALLNLPYDSYNVDFAFMSRQQFAAGDPEVAEWCAEQYAENRPSQVKPQANLVEIKYLIGKKDEARAEFEKLRELAGAADLDSPPLARLSPIAREFDLPTDWRLPAKINKAIAGRRALKSLGPLVWRPWKAPDWKLKDGQGREHSLADFRGKPVLMVFFLGGKCPQCVKQLQAFAKKADELKEEGVNLIAVSVDTPTQVKTFVDEYKKGPYPFLVLSDESKSVFESYRAFDNFEGLAMHGTFLIDREGFVRWHDISFEPFMDTSFVLGESRRLLNRAVPPVEPGAKVIADTVDQKPQRVTAR